MAGIPLGSGFTMNAQLPLDLRATAVDITARNAILASSRYIGLTVHCLADGKNYQLVGGILDSNWKEAGGASSSFSSFASDAAFVTAKGSAAANGDVYYNTTTGTVRTYVAGAWSDVGSGGGGGIVPVWFMGDSPPLPGFVNNIQTYDFDNLGGQQLFTSFKVPNSYKAGKPVTMRSQFTSLDTTGNVWFKTTATLIRNATDLVSSTTNQRLSTNTAITQSTLAGKPQALVCDLSDATGNINGVAVSAGDLILVTLARAVDTSALIATFLPSTSEVIFV